MIAVPPLTRPEALELSRRRARLTQVELGASLGVTADRVRAWEHGERDDCPPVPSMKLEPYEWCWLMRRRSGVTLQALGKLLGLSFTWIHKAERGELTTAKIGVLIEWWSETRCIHE